MTADLLADLGAAMRVGHVLVVVPCSAKKEPGGHSLQHSARSVLQSLPSKLAEELTQARSRNAGAAGVDEGELKPSVERYGGRLYQALGAPARQRVSEGPALILSGGYGVVEGAEPIGDYDQRLQPGQWPNRLLPRVLAAYAEARGCDQVVALTSATGPYQRIVRSAPWPNSVREPWLLNPVIDGGGGMVKAPRALGEALEAAATGHLHDGWRSSDHVGLAAHQLR